MIRRPVEMKLSTVERIAVEMRTVASYRVTKTRRRCDCVWCESGPRRPRRLLSSI